LTLEAAVRNQVREVGLTPAQAARAASLNPAQVLAWNRQVGDIEVGHLADLVILSPDLKVLSTRYTKKPLHPPQSP
jgi:N-acetylglucosamine-6-phosphate deacetylase